MKITLKKEEKEKRKIDMWVLFAIVMIVLAVGIGYIISASISSAKGAQQLDTLSVECAAYGNQLTNDFALNSTLCQENINSSVNSTRVCGAVFYCYYATSCAYTKPVVQNSLSCLCDAATSTQVVLSGTCLKQYLT